MLGATALSDLEREVSVSKLIEPLTLEELDILAPEHALEYADSLFSALPEDLRKPRYREGPDVHDLMRASDEDFAIYNEIVRIMSSKSINMGILYDLNQLKGAKKTKYLEKAKAELAIRDT
ncbi:MAG TPA: hypothetical protein VF401_04090 [Candidatus Saccharimonadales bacterium]